MFKPIKKYTTKAGPIDRNFIEKVRIRAISKYVSKHGKTITPELRFLKNRKRFVKHIKAVGWGDNLFAYNKRKQEELGKKYFKNPKSAANWIEYEFKNVESGRLKKQTFYKIKGMIKRNKKIKGFGIDDIIKKGKEAFDDVKWKDSDDADDIWAYPDRDEYYYINRYLILEKINLKNEVEINPKNKEAQKQLVKVEKELKANYRKWKGKIEDKWAKILTEPDEEEETK